jgi:hypothetical protein
VLIAAIFYNSPVCTNLKPEMKVLNNGRFSLMDRAKLNFKQLFPAFSCFNGQTVLLC